jgi:hypothetical protein
VRRLSTCSSELQSVGISDTGIVTASYDLCVFNKSNYQSKAYLQAHSTVQQVTTLLGRFR